MAVARADPLLRCQETERLMGNPLRIMLDARMLVGRFSGVARVVTSLVDELTKRDDIRVVALCANEIPDVWRYRTDIELIPTNFSRSHRTASRKLWWEETQLAGIVRRAKVDVYHATWNSGVPPRIGIPTLLTIHDLIPWHDRRTYFATKWQYACYKYGITRAVRRATHIACVSEWVRRDVIQKLHLVGSRVDAVLNGVHPVEPSASALTRAEKPYILYVGGHEPRKNIAALFRAAGRYQQRFGDSLDVRITGDRKDLSPDAAQSFAEHSQESCVHFLGTPCDAELAGWYAGATAVVVPSYAEGFGLAALEAMAHGCPVIVSQHTSLPEVVGQAGIVLDPDDADAMADAIHKITTSTDYRETLAGLALSRAGELSWTAAAQKYVRLYRGVLDCPGNIVETPARPIGDHPVSVAR